MKGIKIVIPDELRKKEGMHCGALRLPRSGKTNALLLSKVWFPDLNRLVQEEVTKCLLS